MLLYIRVQLECMRKNEYSETPALKQYRENTI